MKKTGSYQKIIVTSRHSLNQLQTLGIQFQAKKDDR